MNGVIGVNGVNVVIGVNYDHTNSGRQFVIIGITNLVEFINVIEFMNLIE